MTIVQYDRLRLSIFLTLSVIVFFSGFLGCLASFNPVGWLLALILFGAFVLSLIALPRALLGSVDAIAVTEEHLIFRTPMGKVAARFDNIDDVVAVRKTVRFWHIVPLYSYRAITLRLKGGLVFKRKPFIPFMLLRNEGRSAEEIVALVRGQPALRANRAVAPMMDPRAVVGELATQDRHDAAIARYLAEKRAAAPVPAVRTFGRRGL